MPCFKFIHSLKDFDLTRTLESMAWAWPPSLIGLFLEQANQQGRMPQISCVAQEFVTYCSFPFSIIFQEF